MYKKLMIWYESKVSVKIICLTQICLLTLCRHWRWSYAQAPSTSVTALLWITLNQLGHDERTQGVNTLRACESPSRKVLERVRTFYSLINRSLRNRLQGKDKSRIKNFWKLEELNYYPKEVPRRKRERQKRERDFFIRSQPASFLFGQNSAKLNLTIISPYYSSPDAALWHTKSFLEIQVPASVVLGIYQEEMKDGVVDFKIRATFP